MRFPFTELHAFADAQRNFEYLQPLILQPPGWLNPKDYGAKGDGSTDDTGALNLTIAALPSTGGTIRFPPGIYVFQSALNLDNKIAIKLIGASGLSAGTAPGTLLRFAGATANLLARSSTGIVLEDLAVQQSNASFTGTLVDLRHGSGGNDTAFDRFERCSFFGLSATASLFDLDKAISCSWSDCFFSGGTLGHSGQATGGASYSNAHEFRSCAWVNQVTSCTTSPGQGWTFISPTFENLSGGGGAAITCAAATPTKGLSVIGGWFGDAGVAGTWMSLQGGGILIAGNYIGGGLVGVNLAASVQGATIVGNKFDQTGADAVVLGGGGEDVLIFGNDMSTVVGVPVAFSNPIPSNSLIQDPSVAGTITTIAPYPHAGAVNDGSFPATPPDFAQAYDTTNNKLYLRNGGTWRSVTFV